MKTHKNKLMAAVIISLITFAWCVNANAGLYVDNCTAQATGHFNFAVEQAIAITVNDDGGAYGGICPGCDLRWPCGEAGPEILFTVTGGLFCPFKITKENLVPFITECYRLEYFSYFLNKFGDWVILGTNGTPHSFLDDGTGHGIFYIKLQICRLEALCCAQPGNYDLPVRVTVDYVCL